ncbi:MAG: hypothetical protein R6V67_06325 [Spirochaetia bacterium]
MAEEEKEKEPELVLLYADKFGWVDVQNLQKYLNEHCCTECWVFLEQAPVGRVQKAVEEDGRIQMRVTKTPKKSASNFLEELKEKGTKAQMLGLEKVSDRSMNKGGC